MGSADQTSAMPPPSPSPSPSIFLLHRLVHAYPPGYDRDIQGHVLTSGDKLAFGFLAHDEANSVVRDLELEAVLPSASDPSFLILRGANLYTGIHIVDKNLVLISTAFTEVYSREVFLIYNTIDKSLRMIPSMPRTYPSFHTTHVLVARLHDDDKSYALAFPGQKYCPSKCQSQDVLFVAHSSSTSPWETVKNAKFPDNLLRPDSFFSAEQVFSFRGRGYWVDLLVGIAYCKCSAVISEATDTVHIHSLDLPEGCHKYLDCKDKVAEARAFRAIGPVGDSVKFVSIDGYLEHVDLKDCKVTIWTLVKGMKWALDYELKLASLWHGGEFQGNYMPEFMTPMYPFLSPHEDHVIYFALGLCNRGKDLWFPAQVCCMVRVDLHSKTYHCTDFYLSDRNSMSSHIAVSSSAEGKLLGLELSPIPSEAVWT